MAVLTHELKIKTAELIENLNGKSIAEKSEICESFIAALKNRVKNDATRMGYYTQIRKAVKAANHADVMPFLYETETKTALNTDYSTKVAEKSKNSNSENTIALSKTDVENMIETALTAVQSQNVFEVIAALCLLTGRRESELAITAQFEKVGKRVAIFRGQLKKKDGGKDFSAIIPILCDFELVETAQKRLKNRFTIDVATFNTNHCKTLQSTVKRLFGGFNSDITAHKLRAVYAQYCAFICRKGSHYRFFNNEKKQVDYTLNGFVSAILGHNDNDLATANSYISAVKITE